MYIESQEQLRQLYVPAKGRSKDKQLDALEKHSINFIEHSPFLTISTYGKPTNTKSGTLDCSPRGGKPGFIKILNDTCLLIPDAKGNNRLDSLINIIETGSIGCLFLIPGIDETLRVNGTARISTSREHLELFSDEANPPQTCIEIAITEVFLHCAKALMRSKLWSAESHIDRSSFPTMGKMINEQLSITDTPENQDEMVMRYLNDL
ncbi:pyridoxamine 5'-phosphate oxidase family protein [Shewanella eurypsychrophilus]|uniref:Pyridoxamine 5'-phosphate oxidase family protein n=1 Tax=Shewanella eurypsychrophilus TaxID=2593656 RepID=A0ABX6V4J8_9GAMM|nr:MULTISPECIES: pyridoxamine 5'-phosphate oxidase family protein [Shewanella]QFU21589.1 pyridoxamine 5'-phosphate oxidase family protein [Shewanella sp. YLB-09]QPG56879.1 pyridoxamine 5'-phosphate oxidase family protein [Shewanella eurypsychrophilus]